MEVCAGQTQSRDVDPLSAFAARQPNRRPQNLEDDLDPRPTKTESDTDTRPYSSQTDNQRRRMGGQGTVARLCHEKHQRDQSC